MLFTVVVASLFLFLSLTVGNWLSFLITKIIKSDHSSIFETFLLGFALLSCYLNIWSLFLPVNYYALIPVFILSIFILKHSVGTIEKFKNFGAQFFLTRLGFVSIPILLVLICYGLLPPQHGDSPGYHFLTIRWNEHYKTVPGLANLHGRLGFNSSFFVSSAAFAFSSLANQPLYALNIVFAICYYLWIINKIWFYKNSAWSVVFVFFAIAMFRQLIDSISSPTPDVLSTIIISYLFITITENILKKGRVDARQAVVLILLICFAFTVKLNTFPLCLLGLFLLIHKKLYQNGKALLLIIAGSLMLLLPWMIRNWLLTGYLVFPVSVTGFLHPDWQVPYAILHFEKLLINNGPKLISQNWEVVDKLRFTQWFPLWLGAHSDSGLKVSLIILTIASGCAVISLRVFSTKRYSSLFWLAVINVISISFWLYNSPDYRFGYPYLMNAVLLLSLFITRNKNAAVPIETVTAALVIFVSIYYLRTGLNLLSPYPILTYVNRPLQGRQYDPQKNLADFPFITLKNNVKLFVEDSTHACNMAALPCYIPFTETLPASRLRLRGNTIEEGFKLTEK